MNCIQFDTSFIDGSLQLSSSFSSSVKIMNLSPEGCPQGSCISPLIKHENTPYPYPGQYLTSSSVSSFVMLDFLSTSLAGSSFLQAASEKATPMTIMTMKIGNDNFMIGSFSTKTRLLV